MHTRLKVVTLAVFGLGVMTSTVCSEVIGRRSPIGANLSGPVSLQSQWDFVDLMKGSEKWRFPASGGALVPTDPFGNPILAPGEQAETNVRLTISNASQNRVTDYPTGQYTITWEGTGTIVSPAGFITASGPGSRTFNDANGNDSMFLRINSSSQTDPIRNIRIFMPGYGPGEPNDGQRLHQSFVDRIVKPFGSWRFMDWSNANSTTHSQWSQRTRDGANQYTVGTGVPIEEYLRLANIGNGDAWFTMPTHADDDYVNRFAQAVLYGIDANGNPYSSPQADPHVPPVPADRNIYVEYGNEVWNGNFEGFDYVTQQAIAAGLNPSGLNEDFAIQWAVEARRDFDIWTAEFAAAGQLDRLQRVAAIQGANRFISPIFLDQMTVAGVPQFDVISPTFYVGVNEGSYNASTTKDDIIDDLFADLASSLDTTIETFLPGTRFEVTGPAGDWLLWKQFADEAGVKLIAYEGGQHVVPPSFTVPWFQAYVDAQRDERMYDFYTAWLEAIFAEDGVGADGVQFFSSVSQITQFGAWGALEYQDQPASEAPKYRALIDFARGLGDFNLDGVYDDLDIDALRAAAGLSPTGDDEAFDLNDDGAIDELDTQFLLAERLLTTYGDANLDGVVDEEDYERWRAGFGDSGWANGDFSGDGLTNAADYTLWRDNLAFGAAGGSADFRASSTNVPEPNALVLMALGLIGTLALNWRRASQMSIEGLHRTWPRQAESNVAEARGPRACRMAADCDVHR